MHVSLSEIEGTVCKAAWSVGLSLGLGEEAGRAARRLVALGFAPLVACADALEAVAAGTSVGFDPEGAARGRFAPAAEGRNLSALHAAAPLRDLLVSGALDGPVTLASVDQPLLILAELIGVPGASSSGFEFSAAGAVEGGCGAGRLTVTRGALETLTSMAPCALTIRPESGTRPGAGERIDADARIRPGLEVAPELWRRLARLANRRLVEASDLSRVQGAGAGLVDRD